MPLKRFLVFVSDGPERAGLMDLAAEFDDDSSAASYVIEKRHEFISRNAKNWRVTVWDSETKAPRGQSYWG